VEQKKHAAIFNYVGKIGFGPQYVELVMMVWKLLGDLDRELEPAPLALWRLRYNCLTVHQ
jgi:hypothetical protein